MVVIDVAITRERQQNEEQSNENPKYYRILWQILNIVSYMIDNKIRQDAKKNQPKKSFAKSSMHVIEMRVWDRG